MSDVEVLFDCVAKFVSDGNAALEAGGVPHLEDLDGHVKSLCETVLRLSQDQRLKYADRLQQLLLDLKALGDAMVARQELLADEVRYVSAHKKASVAYTTMDIKTDNKEGEE